MCGIVAFIGSKKCDPKDLQILMLANMWRGADATGFFTIETGVIRSCDRVDDFFAKNELPATKLFIGHVRKSTYVANDKKAHPFDIDNIIGVHNGTLSSFLELKRVKYDDLEFPTHGIDSEFLLGALNKDIDILKYYDGAAALVWYDKRKPNILNFYHDSLRPLFRGYKPCGMFLSSTEESLKIIGCTRIKKLSEHVLYEANQQSIVASHCRLIRKAVWKPPISEPYSSKNNTTKSKNGSILSYQELENIFDMEEFVKSFNNWCIFNPKESLFADIVNESYYVGAYVIKIKQYLDTNYWICFSPSTNTYELINLSALEDLPLKKDQICYIMDNNAWDVVTNEIAIITNVIENTEGIVYTVDRYEFLEEKINGKINYIVETMVLQHNDMLGIELLPIFDPNEIEKFEESFVPKIINSYEKDITE